MEEYKENVIQAVELEPESTEAEAANRTLDVRDQDFEAAEVSDKPKDRLNIDKGVPQKTAWMVTKENKETSEPKQEKKQEPKYPFPEDAYPIHAFYTNDKRSKLRFALKQPDGPQGEQGPVEVHDIDDSRHHADAWYWVHKVVGKKAIDQATNKEIDRVNKMRKKGEAMAKDEKHKVEQEQLFQAKITAFEMDVVRQTTHRELKSKIRRAKTILELTAYVGAIIALEYKDESKPN